MSPFLSPVPPSLSGGDGGGESMVTGAGCGITRNLFPAMLIMACPSRGRGAGGEASGLFCGSFRGGASSDLLFGVVILLGRGRRS